MPPRRRVRSYPYLTPERRLQLLEQIRARREARIVARLPTDAVDPEEEEEEEEDGKDMGDADLQAEQQAIFDSHRSESAAEAKRCRLQETEAEHAVDVDEMFAFMDEEEEPEPSYAPIYPAPGTDVVDISHDKA